MWIYVFNANKVLKELKGYTIFKLKKRYHDHFFHGWERIIYKNSQNYDLKIVFFFFHNFFHSLQANHVAGGMYTY